jgi:hypothetical protein
MIVYDDICADGLIDSDHSSQDDIEDDPRKYDAINNARTMDNFVIPKKESLDPFV